MLWQRRKMASIDSSCDSSEQLVGSRTIDLAQLSEDLCSISSRWEDFGSQLAGLTPNKLDTISGLYGLVGCCYKRVIDAWINGPTKNFNRTVLAKALKVIDHERLARRISCDEGVTLDYATLIGELQSCRPKYFQLGVQLGIKPDVIKEWEKNTDNHDCQRCLIEVLSEWLESRYAEENCWLENLEKALNYIRQTRLAEELRRKYEGRVLQKT